MTVETARTVTSADTWTNAWTAIGTMALAALTFATLVYTVIATTFERRQATRDRLAAEARLKDERAASEQRIRDERAHADEVRRRERQIASASGLVRRIAELQACMSVVPGSSRRARFGESGFGPSAPQPSLRVQGDERGRAAIESLRHGAWTEAAMLGAGEAAETAVERYRSLIRLVDEAALGDGSIPDRDVDTLRNYARWVRISLRMLAENETVPPIYGGSAEFPLLSLADHMPAWQPNPIPPGWDGEAEVDPPMRRSAFLRVGGPPQAGE